MQIDQQLTAAALRAQTDRFFELAGPKIWSMHESWDASGGSPVFTIDGEYTARSWTDWTMGFHVGLALLQFDATGEEQFLEVGREATLQHMAPHVSHTGVHDHGFNTISTYGNLRRLMLEGNIPHDRRELNFYELAIKVSGAVQAARYSRTNTGKGYIYSFNGPQSLFVDTMRSMRALVLAHKLGQVLMSEGDANVNLLGRALEHSELTAQYNIWYGEERDTYDVAGRVAHESIFNMNDGQYRCPSTQQGYSPFSTWTRGASWIILGYAEQLEFLQALDDEELEPFGGRDAVEALFLRAARATSDYYIDGYSCLDGIPYWDNGAPGLVELGDYTQQRSDPFNAYEPVDSSAAAISAQGFLRLGRYLAAKGDADAAAHYEKAGLSVARTLFSEPYLSTDPEHQGLLLHVVYHRPNGWDHIPGGQSVPCGESAMWGDYHAAELALLIQRMADGEYMTFF